MRRSLPMPNSTYAGTVFEGVETDQTLFNGKYRVFKLDESLQETKVIAYGYRIVGPRAEWVLLRNYDTPEYLRVLGSGTTPFAAKIRGIEWFREVDGQLNPVR